MLQIKCEGRLGDIQKRVAKSLKGNEKPVSLDGFNRQLSQDVMIPSEAV
ncbi:MAG: hypothetical protein KA714_28575 [Limnoraphis sp. WC205]|jgi:hypothetical protein|nr:hypothetical protein [Limnoraphis sp. WC205]